MNKLNYFTLTLIFVLGACGSGGSKKSTETNLATAYNPAACAAGDSSPEAVVNTSWSIMDPNTKQVNNAYQIAISENVFTVYNRCEDNGLEVEVSVPYEIFENQFIILASDSNVSVNDEGEECELSVSKAFMDFSRNGNTLHFCDPEFGNLTYKKN